MAGQGGGGQQHAQGPFDQFISLMNHDEAKDLVRNINLFMKGFKQGAPDADADSRAVQGFLQQMETAMAKHPLFAHTSHQDQDAATEALEKYLMTKLHERTFRRGADDVERDEALAVRCEALRFVQPHHLEIPAGVVGGDSPTTQQSMFDPASHLGRAVEELNKINKYKAPRDKLVCILNCCSMINAQLARSSKAEQGIGADDFTPVLILVVIKAATPYLASNLAYIERYRYHPKLTAEAQYYYIQLCGAATFIEMVNASSLKVDRDEFIAHMLAAGAMTDQQLAALQSAGNSTDMAGAAAAAAGAGNPADLHNQQQQQEGSHALPPAGGSATQLNIQRSTQAAVAAATAAGLRPSDWQYDPSQQQQQQFPLQMQALPGVGGSNAAAGWPQAALGHSSTGWPYQTQQQQPPSPTPPPLPHQQQQQQVVVLPPLPSVSELESQGAALLSQRDPAAAARQLVSRHPFCCSSLDSLSLGDVGLLLSAYKELVLRYEALSAAVEDYSTQQQQQQQGVTPAAAAGPPPPPAPQAAAGSIVLPSPSAKALTPPSSTGGTRDAVMLAPLSPVSAAAAPSPAAPEPAAPAPAQPESQQQQQEGKVTAAALEPAASSPKAPASDGGSQPAPAAVAAAAADPAPSTAASVAAPPPPAAAPAAAAAGATDSQQQPPPPADSNVDDLLQSLLSPAADPQQQQAAPSAAPQPPAAAAQAEDDLFGLFQRPSSTGDNSAASDAGTSAAPAPSLLD